MKTEAEIIRRYSDVRARLMGPQKRVGMIHERLPDPNPKIKAIPPARIRRAPISAGEIVRRVARWYGVPYRDMVSDSRNHHLVRARQCAMYWIYRRTGRGLLMTAWAVNRVDHTTARHGIKQHIKRREKRRGITE